MPHGITECICMDCRTDCTCTACTPERLGVYCPEQFSVICILRVFDDFSIDCRHVDCTTKALAGIAELFCICIDAQLSSCALIAELIAYTLDAHPFAAALRA